MASLAAQIIDQRISGIVRSRADSFAEELGLGADEPRRRSVAFTFLVAQTLYDLDDDEALGSVVDGGNDFGVDALIHGEPDEDVIHIALIQCKYRQSLDGAGTFPENGIARMIDAIGALFDPGRQVVVNERLRHRIEEIRSFVAGGAIPTVTAIAANNGTRWTHSAQQRIDNAAKDFGNQVEWRHVGPGDLLDLLQRQAPINDSLQLAGLATVEAFQFRRVLIGRCSVGELARLAHKYNNRLFERNIRHYLGLSGNRVNEALDATLRTPAQRPNFYFYNNGITLTCSQFRHNALQHGDWQVRMDDLQIVNGGQTTRTAQKMMEEIGPEIGNAEVLVRIYELPPDEDDDGALIDSITFATNSQNPVDLRDLKANDPRQRTLAGSIRGLGYTYRLKRSEQPVSPDELTSASVAEAVLAVWRQRPHQARFRRQEHFGILYEIIFRSDLNGAQAVIASLTMRQAENRRKRPPPDAPDFLPYGSRFTAMLVGRYVLEDMEATLDQLDHRNFEEARGLLERQAEDYLRRAEEEIEAALEPLFHHHQRPRTLQRLSATFRRADLVEMLCA